MTVARFSMGEVPLNIMESTYNTYKEIDKFIEENKINLSIYNNYYNEEYRYIYDSDLLKILKQHQVNYDFLNQKMESYGGLNSLQFDSFGVIRDLYNKIRMENKELSKLINECLNRSLNLNIQNINIHETDNIQYDTDTHHILNIYNIHKRNIRTLEIKRSMYSLDIPVHIENQYNNEIYHLSFLRHKLEEMDIKINNFEDNIFTINYNIEIERKNGLQYITDRINVLRDIEVRSSEHSIIDIPTYLIHQTEDVYLELTNFMEKSGLIKDLEKYIPSKYIFLDKKTINEILSSRNGRIKSIELRYGNYKEMYPLYISHTIEKEQEEVICLMKALGEPNFNESNDIILEISRIM